MRSRQVGRALVTIAVAVVGVGIAPVPVSQTVGASPSPAAAQVWPVPFAHDPVASIAGLRTRADASGWRIPAGMPVPSQCKHWQGIARSTGMGTPLLFVTRNANAGVCGASQDDEVAGDLSIVEMASREPYGERFRSNRLQKDTDVVDTAPPSSDRTVAFIRFDGSPVVGDNERWPHYLHPGGVQLVGDVLAVALEGPVGAGTPANAVVFIDVANPRQPTIISRFDASLPTDPDRVASESWGAGLVGVTKLADGRYLAVITGKDNKLLRFFVSNGTNLRSDTMTWSHWRDVTEATIESQIGVDWPAGDVTGDAHQSLTFVRSGPNDATDVYLVGGRNTQPSGFGGEDHVDLYHLALDIDGGQLTMRRAATRHLDTHATLTDGTLGSGNIASFKAASTAHVTPTGELTVYATEHDNTGPAGSVNFGEWRYARMARDDSPTYAPTAFANGPYAVAEGGSVQLFGVADPPRTKAWVELYADPGFGSRSAVIDYPDFALDSWDDFDQLDGETTDPDNFSDDASSVRWFAPWGCFIRLNDDDYGDDDFPGDVVVRLPSGDNPQEISDLSSVGADGSITSVSFLQWDAAAEKYVNGCSDYYGATPTMEWDLDGDGTYEVAQADPLMSAAALDGPTTLQVPLRAVHPLDGRTGYDRAEVTVSNVAPTITQAAVHDPSGAEVGVDIPIAVVGVPLTLDAAFTDPGIADTQTATIDWDDGTVDESHELDAFSDASGGVAGSLADAHAYGAGGVYDVVLTVVDDDGGTTSTSLTIEVVSLEEALGLAVDEIEAALGAPSDAATSRALLRARDAIIGRDGGRGADGALDQYEQGNLVAAMVRLGDAVDQLLVAAGRGADVAAALELVGTAANAIAQGAYADALAATDPPTTREQQALDDIEAAIASGVAALGAGDHAAALDFLTEAVREAVSLCGCSNDP